MLKFLPIAFIAATSAGECYAPIMPGLNGCSKCEASELQGSQCVRSGRWFSCAPDADSCCKNPEVANHVSLETCVGQSGGVDPEICSKVVSRVSTLNNDHCAEECQKVVAAGGDVKTDASFNEECMYQHYESVNGRTKVDGKCFEKWVYGYSEPNVNASYKQGLLAETPAQCQLLCQQDPDCVNWLWASDLYNDSGKQDVKHRCDLKSREMVNQAATIKFTDIHPAGLDTKYCNYGLPYQCLQGGFRCMPCDEDGVPSCIWESDMHISGWKHCVPTPQCGRESPTLAPSTTPASTTPTTPAPTTPTTPAPTTTTTLAPTTTPTPAPTTTPTPAPTTTTPTPTTPAPATSTLEPEQSTTEIEESTTESEESTTETEESTTVEIDTTPTGDGESTTPSDSTTEASDECETTAANGSGDCTKASNPCGEPCHCHGRHCSPCCRHHHGVEIHVMDRPKHLAFELDN